MIRERIVTHNFCCEINDFFRFFKLVCKFQMSNARKWIVFIVKILINKNVFMVVTIIKELKLGDKINVLCEDMKVLKRKYLYI